MAVDIPAIRDVVERVCTRKDVFDACKRRDLGAVISVLCAHGITQGQLAVLTGIPQGRLSEYKTRKRMPAATSTFEAFADGLGMPPVARRALGLAPETAGSGPLDSAGGRPADDAASLGDVRPLLGILTGASAIPVLSALRGIHRSYLEADRLMGSMCLTGPVQLQMPVVERACEVTRGADRAEMLGFACQFMEFGGWLFQDAGDLTCAMHWTDRALDYALELGDQRVTAYTLMRKAMIATESGNPAQGLGIANSALAYKDALTPRLRAVILRQRSYSHAVLGEVIASAKDSDEAVIQAIAGMRQGEEDRAPIVRRITWRWKLGRPGFSLVTPEAQSRSWRRGTPSGWTTRRCVIMPCACHAWRQLMPLPVNWSRHAQPLRRPWHLPGGLGRAAWLARSIWFIVGLAGGDRIPPWLACEGV
jgi:hypothetical protein